MKILIVSSGRSGSSNLFKGFYKSLNSCKGYYEPGNPDCSTWYNNAEQKIDFQSQNLITKILSHQWLPINEEFQYNNVFEEFYNNSFFSFSNLYLPQKLNKFYNIFFPHFDNVILLTRKNEINTAKSWAHVFQNKLIGEDAHKSYLPTPSSSYLEYIPLVRNYNDLIYNISINYNIPITYYEDIFTEDKNKIQNFLDLNGIKLDNPTNFYKILNPKNRYKQK